MRALIVYESLFGNTAEIAEAIAASLRSAGHDAETQPVTRATAEDAAGVDLLVVGGPTHVHGMTRSSTRKAAVADEKNTFADPTVEPGLREWLQDVAPGAGRPAAAFDTRIDKPAIVTGSAAKGIARRLERRGFRLVTGPGSFLVSTENRLLPGEVERATAWASGLAAQSVRAAVPT